MHFSANTILLSSTFLTSLSFAIPLQSSGPLVTRYTECKAGTQWYTCAKNQYAGCCSVDPCDLTWCPDTTSTTTPSATSSSTPIATPSLVVKHAIFNPTLYTVHKQYPEESSPATSNITLAVDQSFETHQVIIFNDIPKEAKNCHLQWAQSEKAERGLFILQKPGNGLVSIQVLKETPKEPVTYTKVQALVTEKRVGGADFAGWDEATGEIVHAVGPVDCAETLVLESAMNRANGDDGYVFLEQDQKNGWVLEYEL